MKVRQGFVSNSSSSSFIISVNDYKVLGLLENYDNECDSMSSFSKYDDEKDLYKLIIDEDSHWGYNVFRTLKKLGLIEVKEEGRMVGGDIMYEVIDNTTKKEDAKVTKGWLLKTTLSCGELVVYMVDQDADSNYKLTNTNPQRIRYWGGKHQKVEKLVEYAEQICKSCEWIPPDKYKITVELL